MIPMTKEMREVFDNMSDQEKIRMFYELAKYIVKNATDPEDDDIENLMDDIATVVNDIENL